MLTPDQDVIARGVTFVDNGPSVRITAAMVTELREEFGEPMMVCKDALLQSRGDMLGAADLLRRGAVQRRSERVRPLPCQAVLDEGAELTDIERARAQAFVNGWNACRASLA